MKTLFVIFLWAQSMLICSHELFSQSGTPNNEFGIDAGALTNFPANQNYLKENKGVFYIAPYVRTGRHEFSAGLLYPLKTPGLYFPDSDVNPRPGATAGYKFYIFNIFGRENLFVHYMFQYLRYKGNLNGYYVFGSEAHNWTETDMYINNVIGFGYNLFFDNDERFGFYYTLDYVISQAGYNINNANVHNNKWGTVYVWNNLSTNIGFSFKIASLNKKAKK